MGRRTVPALVHIEVEHLPGRNRLCVDVDQNIVTPELRTLIDGIITDVAADLDLHPETVALLLVDELVQRHHDRAAYEREAARRGVLAL